MSELLGLDGGGEFRRAHFIGRPLPCHSVAAVLCPSLVVRAVGFVVLPFVGRRGIVLRGSFVSLVRRRSPLCSSGLLVIVGSARDIYVITFTQRGAPR